MAKLMSGVTDRYGTLPIPSPFNAASARTPGKQNSPSVSGIGLRREPQRLLVGGGKEVRGQSTGGCGACRGLLWRRSAIF